MEKSHWWILVVITVGLGGAFWCGQEYGHNVGRDQGWREARGTLLYSTQIPCAKLLHAEVVLAAWPEKEEEIKYYKCPTTGLSPDRDYILRDNEFIVVPVPK